MRESTGIGLPMVLFLVFLVLKLTEAIDWPWLWVTAPLWIPVTVAALIIALIGIAVSIAHLRQR